MKKLLFLAIAICTMALTSQNAHAQTGLQLTSSVSSIDLGTVHVGETIPIELDLNLLNLGTLTPNLVNLRATSKQGSLRIGDVVALPSGTISWDVDVSAEPLGAGALSGEALQITAEVPVPLLPNRVLTLEIPVTGTVLP